MGFCHIAGTLASKGVTILIDRWPVVFLAVGLVCVFFGLPAIMSGREVVYYGCGCEEYLAPACHGTDSDCSGDHRTNPGHECKSGKKDYHDLCNCKEPGEQGQGCQPNEDPQACYTTFDCKCHRYWGPDNDACIDPMNQNITEVEISDCV